MNKSIPCRILDQKYINGKIQFNLKFPSSYEDKIKSLGFEHIVYVCDGCNCVLNNYNKDIQNFTCLNCNQTFDLCLKCILPMYKSLKFVCPDKFGCSIEHYFNSLIEITKFRRNSL
jgi:hypothetical protein